MIEPSMNVSEKYPVIYSSMSSFPFSDILWNRPTHVLGEPNNFIILTNMKQRGIPIYIEMPECSVLQTKKTGEEKSNPLIKNGKKYFLDFLFTDVEWLSWLEHLEDLGHKRLLSNQTEWFQTEMTEEDMENLFISPYKMVKGKGGKQFSVRTTFPLDKTLKIFNEKRQQVDYDFDNLGSIITENTRFKTIIEIIGIKCSPRNFHLEMELKQMMILKENPVFVECLISPTENLEKNIQKEEVIKQQVVFKEPVMDIQTELSIEPETREEIIEKQNDITSLLEIKDFDLEFSSTETTGGVEPEKTEKERAIEKMKNIRILGITEFLKKRGLEGGEKILKLL